MQLVYIFCGGLFGIVIACILLLPQLKKNNKFNIEIDKENEELLKNNRELKEEHLHLFADISRLTAQKDFLEDEISRANEHFKQRTQEAENNADTMYKKTIKIMQEQLSLSAEQESKKYKNAKEEYNNQYLQLLKDSSEEYKNLNDNYQKQISSLNFQLDDLKSKTAAAVEANRRAQEDKNKINFYKLQLSDIDIEEIKKLRSITPYLRDSEPLNKVIWKVYYENPYTDLVGRVLGKDIKTGIYKITNTTNNMCYIGQCVDAASRWKQHIKRGIGADTPTRNKLYPAMLEYGVENFTFEFIEECSKEKLNDREQYWQEYFKAKEFGYSIK